MKKLLLLFAAGSMIGMENQKGDAMPSQSSTIVLEPITGKDPVSTSSNQALPLTISEKEKKPSLLGSLLPCLMNKKVPKK
jgi:hypothetical protein